MLRIIKLCYYFAEIYQRSSENGTRILCGPHQKNKLHLCHLVPISTPPNHMKGVDKPQAAHSHKCCWSAPASRIIKLQTVGFFTEEDCLGPQCSCLTEIVTKSILPLLDAGKQPCSDVTQPWVLCLWVAMANAKQLCFRHTALTKTIKEILSSWSWGWSEQESCIYLIDSLPQKQCYQSCVRELTS